MAELAGPLASRSQTRHGRHDNQTVELVEDARPTSREQSVFSSLMRNFGSGIGKASDSESSQMQYPVVSERVTE